MKEIYQDPNRATSFDHVNDLYHVAKGRGSRKKIQKWLSGVDLYTIHKIFIQYTVPLVPLKIFHPCHFKIPVKRNCKCLNF